jgi:hypothetical protein
LARIDKYDPVAGGFRAPLNAAYTGTAAPVGVGINTSGRALPGAAGNTGFVGILVKPDNAGPATPAGSIIDIMTNGEVVDAGLVAGTTYYLNATTGVLQTTVTSYYVGHTVEADRLVVRFKFIG